MRGANMTTIEYIGIGIAFLTPIYAMGLKLVLDVHSLKTKFEVCEYCNKSLSDRGLGKGVDSN